MGTHQFRRWSEEAARAASARCGFGTIVGERAAGSRRMTERSGPREVPEVDRTKEILATLADEQERNEVPADYPELPDLALARYTDRNYYQAEIDTVWRRSWLFAGHESEVPEAGSYRVPDIPFAPILLVRGHDDTIRAFLNACRHRGAPVARGCGGKVKRHLICGFHSWAYDLAGNLVGVTEKRDFTDLRIAERGLTSVRCESWGGFLFVNLDPEAPAFDDWNASLVRRHSDIMTADLRFVHRRTVDVDANWKVVTEAFLETYHLKTVHRTSAAPYLLPRQTAVELYPNGHSNNYVMRKREVGAESLASRRQFHPSDVPEIPGLPDFYRLCPPAPSLFPNVMIPLSAGGFPVITFWPTSLSSTRIEIAHFGFNWGAGDRPSGWAQKVAAFDRLIDEDVENLAPMQRSIEAAAHKGIPLSYQERRIWHLNSEIDRFVRDRVASGTVKRAV
ncbi:aromatic ring-hydroxylating dioxygenase subunit alpha [Amycolatopsis sp. K13G38]|uniref:Aromatic ring-hydroxylating dioxygenase subunit alpha n=1 Tax=Amycolatopsis acididurans TaxID=2724524 RepID=A0ABX1J5T7_9PSEU|nr:aromatic ring-hydroxylating dioxygenase subunit alpha [Amycolatopsis acididurans]NKQ54294.1 aromatic ring-hydroxylating dioxygenase subunit alpha [Amycolatopsis acididurans]